jgi:hypothetical protein
VDDVTLLSLVGNGAWIVGLAVLLANASIQYEQARRDGQTLLQRLGDKSSLAVSWLGLGLVSAGLAATSSSPWETAIWVIAALYSLVAAFQSWRSRARLP